MSRNLLIIFMKEPQPGAVKTRLQPALSADQSCQLYRAMCEDLLAALMPSETFDMQIHFWPPESKSAMRGWLGNEIRLVPQVAGDLGQKMQAAIAASLGHYQRVLIIGSDLPTLGQSRISEAFAALDSNDLVLGPTDDGGYYLVGMKQENPGIFDAVNWSTETVLAQTLANTGKLNLSVSQLPQEADIDTFEEVEALWRLWRNHAESCPIPRTLRELALIF